MEYRSLHFETEVLDEDNHQGNAVVNYTDAKTSYTREYLADWKRGDAPYYPVNNEKNNTLYEQYKELAANKAENIIFGGRLGQYRYYNMDQVIVAALEAVNG